jgi:thioredoxin-related protein
MKKVLLVLLMLVVLTLSACKSDEIVKLNEELAMTEALYEAKLDWYELQYNIDFDDVPNEFILWLMEEHPDVYEYFRDNE